MRKLVLLSFVIVASLQFCGAQSLDKMQWFNEPEQWEIKDKSLSMQVTPQSDYWRISHYGFTVDDAPFYYATYGGEFEVKVKITGDYKQRFDQAGLMLRINHENYIKAGIEFVDGKYNPVQVGFMAACPDGKGFNVIFEHFKVKHLPDQRRLEWLKKNAE